MEIVKRLLCKHDKTEYVSTDLVRQNDGSFITEHTWRCKDCGKLIEGRKHGVDQHIIICHFQKNK